VATTSSTTIEHNSAIRPLNHGAGERVAVEYVLVGATVQDPAEITQWLR
jgi:hypothetical protein